MKTKYYFLLFFVFVFEFSFSQNKVNIPSDYALQAFSKLQKENIEIISLISNCLNNDDYTKYSEYWQYDPDEVFIVPYKELFDVVNRNAPGYKPTLLAIQKKENEKYLIKIGIMGSPEGFYSLDVIYNFYAVKTSEGFKFKNFISQELLNWDSIKIRNIKYYYPKNTKLNKENVEKQQNFEDKLISLFNFHRLDYTYISCYDNKQLMTIKGFDYEDTMFYNDQTGGEAHILDKVIFSGNNSEFYPHELVHLYNFYNFKKIHNTIDEGLATFFGGSKELDYKNHISELKKFVTKNNIDTKEYLFDDMKKYTLINHKSSFLYSIGALLCDLAYKKKGVKGLEEIANTGKSNEELQEGLERFFKIKKGNFDTFIKKELIKYD